MADSVVEFERRIAGRDVKPAGELRITTVDSIAVYLLPPILARFRQLNPGVHLDIILAAQHLNLSRRDADVAIRATNEPPETLIGRRIGAIRWAVYASPKLAAEYGAKTVEEAPWVGFGDGFGSTAIRRWIERNVDLRRQACRVNSVLSIAEFDRRRRGRGDSALLYRQCRSGPRADRRPIGELDIDLWVLTHPDLRHSARVRAFTDYAGSELAKLRKTLEGG